MTEQHARNLADRLNASAGLRAKGFIFRPAPPRFGKENPRRTFGVSAIKARKRVDYMSTMDDVIVFLVEVVDAR